MHDFATDRESDRDKYHHPGLGHAQRGTRKQQLTGIFGDGHKRREQKYTPDVWCVHLTGFLDVQVVQATNASLQQKRRADQYGRAGNILTALGAHEF